MSKLVHTGSLDMGYARERTTKKSLRYRLWRRTHEVLEAIDEFCSNPPRDIIDLGTADGRMLDMVHQKYPDTRCAGVEYNQELVDFGKTNFPGLDISQGDIQSLDYPDNSFDVVIATAVIEHLPNPGKAMREVKRVLRAGGLLVLTAPDPFWEHIATMVGHLKDDQHNEVMNLVQLRDLAKTNGFVVLKSQKFMLSPVGMPFEFGFEKIIRSLRLNFLMANQLLVARC
ncbi:class I SAM-dependent methyltransferase [bacterium]|nr:class I SAM-dependent methyltransferase [bacterium]